MDPTRTLISDLIREHPAAGRVLERHRIDVCCGGGRTLAEACAQAGIAPAALLAALAADAAPVADEAARGQRTTPDLIRHLEATYHACLHVALPRLRMLVARVVQAHGGRHPDLIELGALVPALAERVEAHLDHAGRSLLPAILAGKAPAMADADFAWHVAPLERMRALCDGYAAPDHACASWRGLYAGLADLDRDLRGQIALTRTICRRAAATAA